MRPDPLSRHIGTRVAGRYRVVSELSRGGMGVVFRAVQEPLEREIALKIMLPGPAADLTLRRRFIQEAQALSRTVHPNIVTIFDFGEVEDGSLFIAMELIHGKNLRELLQDAQQVPWRDTVQMVTGAVRALAAAHGAGITHRDLKPDNVMLVANRWRADDVKLLDFGLARTLGGDDGLTQINVIPGTPHYIAPERISSKVEDPRSDLYALGAIWFELLTGRLPFDGDTVAAILLAHVQKPAPLVSEVAPQLGVPAEVERLIARLLAKQPADRWPDAHALLAELEGRDPPGGPATAPTPVAAPPPARPQPSRWTNSSANTVSPARFSRSALTPSPAAPGSSSVQTARPLPEPPPAPAAPPEAPKSPAAAVPTLSAPAATEEPLAGITIEHQFDEARRRLVCAAIFRGRLLRKVEVEVPPIAADRLGDWITGARADFAAGLRGLAAPSPPSEPPEEATPPRSESAETRLFFFALDSWLAGERDTAIRTLESLRAALPDDERIANSYKALLLESSRA